MYVVGVFSQTFDVPLKNKTILLNKLNREYSSIGSVTGLKYFEICTSINLEYKGIQSALDNLFFLNASFALILL